MRRLLVLLGIAVLVAGCGASERHATPPPPKLPHALAQRLAAESDAVATAASTGDACRAQQLGATLRADTNSALGRIPARFQGPLSSGVNAVLAELPQCVPVVAASPPRPRHDRGHGHGHHGHGHGEGD